jgi:hypothetical protein
MVENGGEVWLGLGRHSSTITSRFSESERPEKTVRWSEVQERVI